MNENNVQHYSTSAMTVAGFIQRRLFIVTILSAYIVSIHILLWLLCNCYNLLKITYLV